MSARRNAENLRHHHRGKSSEKHLDKNAILTCLMIGPGEVVLDAGCGNGYMAKEFARLTGKTGKVYALDPDTTSIEVLKSETEGTNIEPFVGDITEETRLPTSSIDVIYAANVIHGFSRTEMKGFLKEADRLLKPNGRLAIVEIKKEETPFGPPLHIRFSPEELKQLVKFIPTQLIHVGQFFYMQTFKKE